MRVPGENLPPATSSTTNPTWTGLGSSPEFCSGMLRPGTTAWARHALPLTLNKDVYKVSYSLFHASSAKQMRIALF